MTIYHLCLACAALSQTTVPVEVEGDLRALRMVRDVQASNRTAFPIGSAKFRAVQIQLNSPMSQERIASHGAVVWKGANSSWDYQEQTDARPLGGEWELRRPPRGVREIRTPQSKFLYSHSVTPKRAQLTYRDLTRGQYDLAATPDKVWYGPNGSTKDWGVLLDPAFNVENTRKLVAERRGSDEIVVVREYLSDASLTITCSLASGGNIVRVKQSQQEDSPDGPVTFVEEDHYEWHPLGDGRFRLKRLEHTVTRADRDEPHYSYVLEIEELDLNPMILSNQFALESLHLESGTEVIEERNGVRNRSVIGKPASDAVTQETLDRLAEEAKQKGFAQPKP